MKVTCSALNSFFRDAIQVAEKKHNTFSFEEMGEMKKIELHIFIQDSKTIQILRPPEAPTISGLPTNSLREGDQLTLTCNSHHGNPLPTLKWYRQGEYIQTQVCALCCNKLNNVLTPFSSDLF